MALANSLRRRFPAASLVVAADAHEAGPRPVHAGVEVIALPTPVPEPPTRLLQERLLVRRRRLLNNLFDAFLPDLVIVDAPASSPEPGMLLLRAQAFGARTQVVPEGASFDHACEAALGLVERVAGPAPSSRTLVARPSAVRAGRERETSIRA